MSIKLAKTSNYTGLENLYFNLDDYLSCVDTDLKNLFFMANPTLQFGSGGTYSVIVYSGGNANWTSILGGWNITADLLYAGAGSTYIGLEAGTGIWLGDPVFANAPFSVDQNGVIKAHSGDIGGWNINATYIKDHSTDNNANILLDSVNGLVRVGPDTGNNYITIDGKNLYVQSSNYVSGPLGQGWHIDTDLAEFQNIRARGMFKTATFEYDVISALGGQFLVANSDILETDMTADDTSSLKITSGTHFNLNDILRIKDGVDDEWLKVTGSTTAYTYTVTRDMDAQYTADANPIWKKGTCVVSYGSAGNGVIFMSGAGPNIDVITHTGSPYDYAPTQLRIGNLNGFLGYTTKTYGIAIGNATQYLKYDTSNGFRIAGHTLLGTLEINTGGNLRSGQTTWDSGSSFYMDFNNGTPRFSIGTSGSNRMTWNGTNLNVVGAITIQAGSSGIANLSDVGPLATGTNLDDVANGTNYVRTTPSEMSGAGYAYSAVNSNFLIQSGVVPTYAIAPAGAGLYLSSGYMGYYDSADWAAYIDSAGNFAFKGSASQYISWDGSALKVSNIQSPDYVASTTGYKLSASNGLEINDGDISAYAIKLKTGGGVVNINGDLARQIFFSSSSNFTAPTGVNSVLVTMIGAGGGGGGGDDTNGSGGGGSGAYIERVYFGVTANNSYTVVVGTGGAGGSASAGVTGGNSSFSGSNWKITCNGGNAGAKSENGGGAGAATGSNPSTYLAGTIWTTAGTSGANGSAGATYGGGGAQSRFGGGGNGGNGDGNVGNNAIGYGSGGGGGCRANGGNGTNGFVLVEYLV